MLDRADGALFSTPTRQTMVLRFEIAVFGTYRRVRHLGQHRVEVTVGRGGFAAAPFAGTFMPEKITLVTNDVLYVPMSGIGRADLWVKQHLRDILPSEIIGYGAYRGS